MLDALIAVGVGFGIFCIYLGIGGVLVFGMEYISKEDDFWDELIVPAITFWPFFVPIVTIGLLGNKLCERRRKNK